MRKIICRFSTKQDLDKLNHKLNGNYTNLTKEINLKTKESIDKRIVNSNREINNSWESYWNDLPEFIEPKVEPYAKIDFIVDDFTENELSETFEQNITDRTKSIWFPALEKHTKKLIRVVGGKNPRYPIFIVSKGRASLSKCLSVKWLNKMETRHYVVVEPNEFEEYQQAFKDFKYTRVIKLDMRYKENYNTLDDLGDTKGKGPGAARNYCMDISLKKGYKWCWVLDDNIDGFHYLNHNIKHKMRTGVCFSAMEDFVERFDNIGLAGLNYSKFCKECDRTPAYVKNTRIYSILMCNNELKYRWRGRYNEDTIISLDILSDGLCTLQLNTFLADKLTTQRIDGGNNDMFYSKEGTEPKTDMLVKEYPQYATKVFKFSRIHHHVDYSSFTQELHYDSNYHKSVNKVNNYGMKIVKIPEEWDNTDKDTKSYIEAHIKECELLKGDN